MIDLAGWLKLSMIYLLYMPAYIPATTLGCLQSVVKVVKAIFGYTICCSALWVLGSPDCCL